jgi:hypothetical protein
MASPYIIPTPQQRRRRRRRGRIGATSDDKKSALTRPVSLGTFIGVLAGGVILGSALGIWRGNNSW